MRAFCACLVAGLFGFVPAAHAAQGDISTVAGTTPGFSGDGGPAIAAQLSFPGGVVATPDGGFLISDGLNHRIRKVSPTGIIETVAGTGTGGFNGDGVPATTAQLNNPRGLALTADGGFLVSDVSNHRIRKVSPDGIISTIAGIGTPGFSGDNGAATVAQLQNPNGVATTADGGFLIADGTNQRVRQVSPAGVIATVAGTGASGYNGDNILATTAQLASPTRVAATPDGGFLIADQSNQRVRKVSSGIITTVAGNGTAAYGGDNGQATAAQLNAPSSVTPTADGGFLIDDRLNQAIRKVSAEGIITTVAGTGPPQGFGGDGGPATAANLANPSDLATMPDGGFLIADSNNDRVRRVEGAPAPPECGPGAFFVILGTPAAETISGTVLRDAILGREANDTLNGAAGADCLLGEEGDDGLFGGPDDDILLGGPGNDAAVGETGDDTARGGDGDDSAAGGPGNDTINGEGGKDTANGGSGDDRLNGGKGKDKLIGRTGRDRLVGGKGRDRLVGGKGRDRLVGGKGRDRLVGGKGRDLLLGGRGNDRLVGGKGRDRLVCGPGKKDVAIVGKGDRVSRSCEKVR